jgi:hypothetical protein
MSGKSAKAARKAGTDPRRAGGTIAGPGGPHERNGVVIDTTDSILMDSCTVAMVEPYRDGRLIDTKPWWVLNLAGRINKRDERADIAYLFDMDGAAAIITELLALASRQGADVNDALLERISERMGKLASDGNL